MMAKGIAQQSTEFPAGCHYIPISVTVNSQYQVHAGFRVTTRTHPTRTKSRSFTLRIVLDL